jgi:hypothetical protein
MGLWIVIYLFYRGAFKFKVKFLYSLCGVLTDLPKTWLELLESPAAELVVEENKKTEPLCVLIHFMVFN